MAKWLVAGLAGASMLVVGLTQGWIPSQYASPKNNLASTAVIGQSVSTGSDGKLKLFDNASKYKVKPGFNDAHVQYHHHTIANNA